MLSSWTQSWDLGGPLSMLTQTRWHFGRLGLRPGPLKHIPSRWCQNQYGNVIRSAPGVMMVPQPARKSCTCTHLNTPTSLPHFFIISSSPSAVLMGMRSIHRRGRGEEASTTAVRDTRTNSVAGGHHATRHCQSNHPVRAAHCPYRRPA